MTSFSKVRVGLARWLLGLGADSDPLKQELMVGKLLGDQREIDRRIRSFAKEIRARSDDWPSRVRLINLNRLRDRVSGAWPKVRDKIDLFTQKIIRTELSGRDHYLKVGETEYLLFFADASPQEAKLRSLAIVERIHDTLLGQESDDRFGSDRFAECHMARRQPGGGAGGIRAHANSSSGAGNDDSMDELRQLFSDDAERLESADVSASVQSILDLIISRAVETHGVDELEPLTRRALNVSRSLASLKPALQREVSGSGSDRANLSTIRYAEQDVSQLTQMLQNPSNQAHGDVVEAIKNLRSARKTRTDQNRRPVHDEAPAPVYLPLLKSVSMGEKLYRSIYQVALEGQESGDASSGGARHQDDLLVLEKAIQCCTDRTTYSDCMFLAPVHVETLERPHLHLRYSTVLRAANLAARRRLAIEVVGFRPGDDTISIRRSIEELRVHAAAIVITQTFNGLEDTKAVVNVCKRLGVHAVGLDISDCPASRAMTAVDHFIKLGLDSAIPTYVSGITSPAILARAINTGVHYVSSPCLIPPHTVPRNIELVTLDHLYWSI